MQQLGLADSECRQKGNTKPFFHRPGRNKNNTNLHMQSVLTAQLQTEVSLVIIDTTKCVPPLFSDNSQVSNFNASSS